VCKGGRKPTRRVCDGRIKETPLMGHRSKNKNPVSTSEIAEEGQDPLISRWLPL
jgi:hypothetical protein